MVAVLERVSNETLRRNEPQIPGRPEIDTRRSEELDAAVRVGETVRGKGVSVDPGVAFVSAWSAARSAPETRNLPVGDPAVLAATQAGLGTEAPVTVPTTTASSILNGAK